MTPEQIDAALALCDAATPGPWRNGGRSAPVEVWHDHSTSWNSSLVATTETRLNPDPISPADPAFIAAARTGWPEALHALQRVLVLHAPWTTTDGLTYCTLCYPQMLGYPCATVRAITGGTE